MKVFNYKSDYAHQTSLKKQETQVKEEPGIATTSPIITHEANVGNQVQRGGEREAITKASEKAPSQKKTKTKKETRPESYQPEETI